MLFGDLGSREAGRVNSVDAVILLSRGTASDKEGAANKLNKQSRIADEGWSSSLGVGRGSNNPSL